MSFWKYVSFWKNISSDSDSIYGFPFITGYGKKNFSNFKHLFKLPWEVFARKLLILDCHLSARVTAKLIEKTPQPSWFNFCCTGFTLTYICDALHNLVSVTFANAFFYLSVVSMHFHELVLHSNRSIKCEMLECHSNG